jgi:hypothetical protein
VDHALRDALPVEVGDLLQELVVLKHERSAIADGTGVLVVVDRVALTGGQGRVASSVAAVRHVLLLMSKGLVRPVAAAAGSARP